MERSAFYFFMYRLFDIYKSEMKIDRLSISDFKKAYKNVMLTSLFGYLQDCINYDASNPKVLTAFRDLQNIDVDEMLEVFFQENEELGYIKDGYIEFFLDGEYDEDIMDTMDDTTLDVTDYINYNMLTEHTIDLLGMTHLKNELKVVLNSEKRIEEAFRNHDKYTIEIYNRLMNIYIRKLVLSSPVLLENRTDVLENIILKNNINELFECFGSDLAEVLLELYRSNADLLPLKAIFLDNPLYKEKLLDHLESVYAIQPEGIKSEKTRAELINNMAKAYLTKFKFIHHYIINLDNCIKNNDYADELETTKQRLLYILNTPGVHLLDESSYNSLYQQILQNQPDTTTEYSNYCSLAALFIDDIFEKDQHDLSTLKELLFIKTYLDITADPHIVDTFESYSDCPNYEAFESVIKSKPDTINTEKVKQLIKK